GGAGRTAPAAGTRPALRSVLGGADLSAVLAGARQAAVLPLAGTGRHDAAAVRRDRHVARTPAETRQHRLAGHLAAGRGQPRVRAAAVRAARPGGRQPFARRMARCLRAIQPLLRRGVPAARAVAPAARPRRVAPAGGGRAGRHAGAQHLVHPHHVAALRAAPHFAAAGRGGTSRQGSRLSRQLRGPVPFPGAADPADRGIARPRATGRVRPGPSRRPGRAAPRQASPGRAALRAAGAAVPLLVAGGMARRHAARPAQRLHAARAGAAAAGLHGRRRALAHAAVSKDALIASLRGQCGGPRDGALLRYALGNALLEAGDAAAATEELRQALRFDPRYSAAWKLLGKACLAADDRTAAASRRRRRWRCSCGGWSATSATDFFARWHAWPPATAHGTRRERTRPQQCPGGQRTKGWREHPPLTPALSSLLKAASIHGRSPRAPKGRENPVVSACACATSPACA